MTSASSDSFEISDGMLILGMHRSGTSALMGALSLLGVELGEPLMPANEGVNARGYFEHLEVYHLHQTLLDRFGHVWDDLRSFEIDRLPPRLVADAVDELSALLLRHFQGVKMWAVKDPRICRLQPIWGRALRRLGSSPRYIIALRHPDEVVASLGARDGFSRDKSDLLWADHLLASELHTRGTRRAFVSFDGLLREPMPTLHRLAAQLGLTWPRSGSSVATAIEEFLDRGLRHHEVDSEIPPRGRLGDVIPRAYAAASAAEEDPESLDTEVFDACRQQLRQQVEQLEPLVIEQAAQMSIRERRLLAHQFDSRLEELRGELDERDRRLDQQQNDLHHLLSLVQSLESQLGERTEWLQIQDRILHQQISKMERFEHES